MFVFIMMKTEKMNAPGLRTQCKLLILVALMAVCAGRQMCYSCSFVGNVLDQGIECVTYVRNWTFGNWKLRCPNVCTINSIYNKETGEATYLERGCSGPGKVPEDNCVEGDVTIQCYVTCDSDYCNDGPGVEDKFLDIVSDGAESSRLTFSTGLLETLVAMVILIMPK